MALRGDKLKKILSTLPENRKDQIVYEKMLRTAEFELKLNNLDGEYSEDWKKIQSASQNGELKL